MKLFHLACAFAFSMAAWAPANAVTLTFDSINGIGVYTVPYSESGFTFTMSAGGEAPHFGDGALPNAGTLSWHEGPSNPDDVVVTLAKVGGGTFNFLSFDLAGLSSPTPSFAVSADGFGPVLLSTLTTHNLNWSGVNWVTFQVFGTTFPDQVAIDNVQLSPSEVPLPAALPLLASALIGGGVIAWRKKRKQKAEPLAA